MNNEQRKWFYLVVLSLIWGSSYILIKKGLEGLNPIQLGGVRIIFSTAFLAVVGLRSVKKIKRSEWKWVAASALCGTFIPVFLFAYAETEIDSAIASILNSLVPLFTIIIGFVVFKIRTFWSQVIGVLLGLAGAGVLIFQGAKVNPDQNYFYTLLVVLAALMYAINANIIKSKLQKMPAMAIATGSFLLMLPAAIALTVYSFLPFAGGSEELPSRFWSSVGYVGVLSVFGTGLAKIMFNRLIQISTPVFSTSVTYLIPVVGIFWGVLDGEKFTFIQVAGALIILMGVYLVNRGRK
ncbi:permease [Robertkochia marina]|uniref:Permease n=1 Tax=Robertkochia marina TaxID=1227945 RepID=A0A4S3M5Q7_9FLAO|nr:EamA family transporter [Robertkochia marina]THD69557.1 permease [Robertkochia marina]TRZ47186.1 permease [Robertkochia marina]